MFWHGLTRWLFTADGVPKYVDYLGQFAVPYTIYAGWGVTILELVGGIFLILGALTRVVALLALVQQVLLISYTNYWRGPDLVDAAGAYVGRLGVQRRARTAGAGAGRLRAWPGGHRPAVPSAQEHRGRRRRDRHRHVHQHDTSSMVSASSTW